MAKYKSLFNVEGSIGEVTFYKGEDGFYIRSKGGVSKDRILNDPAFVRTRENNSEFAESATSGKKLRHAITALLIEAKDNRMTSRLTQIMSRVKNADITSARGQRKVSIGINTTDGKNAIKGFEFNNNALLSSVLLEAYSLNTTTGEISMPNFIPAQDLNSPNGSTHVSFNSGFLNLNFNDSVSDLQISPTVNLPINSTLSPITLIPAAPPTGTGTPFYFLKVAFYQEVNGTQYPLKNGTFNALQLIDVL
ncbi:hypothetical protein FNB79_09340 [Formosa sediminum]|uniref:Uncharacterized protein n=1 Tax=Formosa sediminum TaxID=2594004 RepID=A0A516GRM5_9FLAO|nr:hypothetical protein [Formosa sediminum]QDO94171.1 hypothetical protein FNB79_09340 [Formosa sediminum]